MSLQAFGGEPVDEAALIAFAAYPGNLGSSGNLETYLSDNGWNLKRFSGADPDGYYTPSNAAAFAAEKGDTLAVAIRGSDLNEGLLDDLRSGAFDPSQHYSAVLPYIKEAIKYANSPDHSEIHKILITGHSLGGQAAELFAVDSTSLADLGRFWPEAVSIVTFGSPGIPKNDVHSGQPDLQSRVLDIYNFEDPVYNILKDNVHVGIQKPLYNPSLSDPLSTYPPKNPLEAHFTYQNQIEEIAGSKLSDFTNDQTVFIFGTNDSLAWSDDILDVSKIDSQYGIPKESQHFLIGLDGYNTLIGGAGDDLLDGGVGDDLMTGGLGHDQFAAFTGKDTITDFNSQEDSLWLPGGTITGTFNGHDTVLMHPEVTVTLAGVNLGPEASEYPWLQWSEIPWFILS